MTQVAHAPRRRDFLTRRHVVANLLHVLATHALLVAWFAFAWRLLPLVIYVPLSLLASLMHQRAMSEWLHEGCHFNMVSSRRWNDLVTDALCSIWVGVTVAAYRRSHFPHHSRTGFFAAGDPDTSFLAVHSRSELRRAVARDLAGVTVLRQFLRFSEREDGNGESRVLPLLAAAAAQVALLAVLLAVGRLDAWIIYYASLATLYPLLNRLRAYGQHMTVGSDSALGSTGSDTSRTIDAGLLDRVLHTSPRLLYHYEHHRYPHLPWRALPGICARSEDPNRYATARWPVLARIYRELPEAPV